VSCQCCNRCDYCSKCTLALITGLLPPVSSNARCYGPHKCGTFQRYFTLYPCEEIEALEREWGAQEVEDCDCSYKRPLLMEKVHSCDKTGYRRVLSHCSDPSLPPVGNITVAKLLGGSSLVCYGGDDMVCRVLSKSGGWESRLLLTLALALERLHLHRINEFSTNPAAGVSQEKHEGKGSSPSKITRFSDALANTSRFAQDDVEFIDIGANVGAFSFAAWSLGYNVRSFEALPTNVQLLRMSSCLNKWNRQQGLYRGAPHQLQDNEVTITHAALGNEEGKRCLMLSEDNNFGDTHITCNQSLVNAEEEFLVIGNSTYSKRGFVQLTRLDYFVKRWNHFASEELQRAHEQQKEYAAADAAAEKGVDQRSTSGKGATGALDLTYKDYVVKIDVEGNEAHVMEGAKQWLTKPYKPRLILSEVWASTNLTKYVEFMLSFGYRLYIYERKAFIANLSVYVRHLESSEVKIDTYVFVLPDYMFIFNLADFHREEWVPPLTLTGSDDGTERAPVGEKNTLQPKVATTKPKPKSNLQVAGEIEIERSGRRSEAKRGRPGKASKVPLTQRTEKEEVSIKPVVAEADDDLKAIDQGFLKKDGSLKQSSDTPAPARRIRTSSRPSSTAAKEEQELKLQSGSNSDEGLWSLGIEPEGELKAESQLKDGKTAQDSKGTENNLTASEAPAVSAAAASGVVEGDTSAEVEVPPPPTPIPNRITVRGVLSKRQLADEKEEELDEFAAQAVELQNATAALVVKKDTRFTGTVRKAARGGSLTDTQPSTTALPLDEVKPTATENGEGTSANSSHPPVATKPKRVGLKKKANSTEPSNSAAPKKRLKPRAATFKPKAPSPGSGVGVNESQ
jgi:hypothetical protein